MLFISVEVSGFGPDVASQFGDEKLPQSAATPLKLRFPHCPAVFPDHNPAFLGGRMVGVELGG